MKAESRHIPEPITKKGRLYIVRWNVQEVVRKDDDGEDVIYYTYDSVIITKLTKDLLVPAMIRTKYSENDEFKMGRLVKTSTEWKEYDAFAKECIAKADEIL
jgi:hypothetical protein